MPAIEPREFYFGNKVLLLLVSYLQGTFPNGKVTLCIKGLSPPSTEVFAVFVEQNSQSGGIKAHVICIGLTAEASSGFHFSSLFLG